MLDILLEQGTPLPRLKPPPLFSLSVEHLALVQDPTASPLLKSPTPLQLEPFLHYASLSPLYLTRAGERFSSPLSHFILIEPRRVKMMVVVAAVLLIPPFFASLDAPFFLLSNTSLLVT